MTSLSVVVPVYNESNYISQFIARQVRALQRLKLPFELIISENGSRDDTLHKAKLLAKKYPQLKVITSPKPNYGLAVRHGFFAAQKQYLALFDLDYFDTNFITKALPKLKHYDAVIASKNTSGSKDERSLARQLTSRVFSLLLRLLFGYQLTDTHGIKILNRRRFQPLISAVKNDAEIFDSELLLRGQLMGLKLTEIGITVRERRPSRSSIIKRASKTLGHLWIMRQQFKREGLL